MRVGWQLASEYLSMLVVLHMTIEYREIWTVPPAVVVVQGRCPPKQKQSRGSDISTIFRGKKYRKGRIEVHERMTEVNPLNPLVVLSTFSRFLTS